MHKLLMGFSLLNSASVIQPLLLLRDICLRFAFYLSPSLSLSFFVLPFFLLSSLPPSFSFNQFFQHRLLWSFPLSHTLFLVVPFSLTLIYTALSIPLVPLFYPLSRPPISDFPFFLSSSLCLSFYQNERSGPFSVINRHTRLSDFTKNIR